MRLVLLAAAAAAAVAFAAGAAAADVDMAALSRVADALAERPAVDVTPDVALLEEQAGMAEGLQRRRFAWLKKLSNAGKNLWDKKEGLKRKLAGDKRVNYAQAYEDCMGCRLIWKQVEMDVSNARYIEDVQASFEHNCMDAQKSNIFYKVCEDMYDDVYAMTDDYMSNKWSVDKMCQRARMCTL